MHSSLACVAARVEWLESAVYGSTQPWGAPPPPPARFLRPILPRLEAAVAALDRRLSLEAKLSLKQAEAVLAGPGEDSVASLPPASQRLLLLSASGDVEKYGRLLQAVHETSAIALDSPAIAGE